MYIYTEEGIVYSPKAKMTEEKREEMLEKEKQKFLLRTGVLQPKPTSQFPQTVRCTDCLSAFLINGPGEADKKCSCMQDFEQDCAGTIEEESGKVNWKFVLLIAFFAGILFAAITSWYSKLTY